MKFLQTEIKIDKNRRRYGLKYKTCSLVSNILLRYGNRRRKALEVQILPRPPKKHGACWQTGIAIYPTLKAQGSRLQYASFKPIKSVRVTVLRLILGTRFLGMPLDKLVFLLSLKTSKASCLGGY